MTRHVIAIALSILGVALRVDAQTATPSSSLAWDQLGQAPALASGATYRLYVDGAVVGSTVASVTCAVGPSVADATCVAPLPPLTAGQHTVTLSQIIDSAESPQSIALTFSVVIVVRPTSLRLR